MLAYGDFGHLNGDQKMRRRRARMSHMGYCPRHSTSWPIRWFFIVQRSNGGSSHGMSLYEALEAHSRCITLHDSSFGELDGNGFSQ